MKKMSSREHRISAYWLTTLYNKVMKKPLRGFITYGGGLNILEWIKDAESNGYIINMTVNGVELR